MSKVVCVALHVGKSLAPSYSAALGGVPVRTFSLGAASAAYDETTGLASRYPDLAGFLAREVPEYEPGDVLVLVAFSAGCWAPRYWMKNASDRALVGALVLLDGLHSGFSSSGGCKLEAIDGIVAFANLAGASYLDHLLVLTHTAIVPPGYASTTLCAALLDEVANAGPGRGMEILGFPGNDAAAHNAQQREVGPAVLAEYVAPWLGGAGGASTLRKLALVGLVAGAAAVAAYALMK
jgi:hypothetical protein